MHPIDRLCEEYGITRYRLASDSGIGQSNFSALIYNKSKASNMRLGTAKKIATTLNLTVDELYEKLLEYESEVQP